MKIDASKFTNDELIMASNLTRELHRLRGLARLALDGDTLEVRLPKHKDARLSVRGPKVEYFAFTLTDAEIIAHILPLINARVAACTAELTAIGLPQLAAPLPLPRVGDAGRQ